MPERNGRHQQQSFSFVVADNRTVTEYAIHIAPDILEHIAVCLQEIRRHHDTRHTTGQPLVVKKKTVKAVLPFKKRKRTA